MDPSSPTQTPAPEPVAFEPFASDASAYAVKLSVFEGPLDLLLHLIRMNEVDITDIPITRVAQQYLEYVDLMRELNLDVAGEYLLMAATLAWIKSRMLLPPDGEPDDEEGLDPRAELVARLLEYQRFKEAAGELGERIRLGRDVFEVRGPEPERPSDAEREVEVGALELLEALRAVLKTASAREATHELDVEEIHVRDRMLAVMDMASKADSVEFSALLRGPDGEFLGRAGIVATFLAILELARLAALRIFQSLNDEGSPEGPIRLRCAGDGADDWMARISEIM
jgi:segregation and condensation protein A